ncbi:MAG: MFS transporter [Candidatus Dormibacteraceae bacterium]
MNLIPRRWLLLAVMCVGMFLVLLDATVVNVALPQIRVSLAATFAGQQWVVDGYAVVLASLLLGGGAAGDRYGHKRIVLIGLGVFGIASLICGVAPNIDSLITGRALQGLGAALLLPGTLAIITHAFPEREEQARAVGVWAGVSSLALPAGPLLGGALVSFLGWRSIFLINLPVIMVAAPATVWLVAESVDGRGRRLDLLGSVLAAITLGTAVFAIISGEHGGVSIGVVLSVVTAGVALLAFLCWEGRASDPLLPLRLFRAPAFVGANLVAAAMNLVGVGTVFISTLYLQTVQHHSPLEAGVMLLPLFIPLAVFSPLTGRLAGRYGPRAPMSIGLLIGAFGSASLIGLSPSSSYLRFLPVLLGLGLGMSLMTAAIVAAAVQALPADRAGLASGVNNAARQAAGALGIAIYGAIAGSPTESQHFATGLHYLGLTAVILWLAAIVLAWLTIRPLRAS